jgi:DNA-binding IclR family transcriptional regulator
MSRPTSVATGTESGRKLLSVLLCFSGSRPAWTVADIAGELQLSQSSAYRYVAQLREVGLLEQGAHSTYHVTERVLSLADAAAAGRSGLLDVAMPVMTQLRDTVGETVLLARRAGESAFLVDRVESRHPVRLQFMRGQAMALHAGSMPRLLLAHMPRAERAAYLDKVRGQLSARQRELLTEDLFDDLRRTGTCESFEEIDEGIWGTAAVVCRGEEVLGVIGCAGPVYRLDAVQRAEVRERLRSAALEISQQLG